MKILITGGAGYLGTVLTEVMLTEGHQVRVIDSFEHGVASLLHLVHHKDLSIANADVRTPGLLEREVPWADVIFPLAAVVGAPACAQRLEDDVISINIEQIERICGAARSQQIIIYPNTNSGYGKSTDDEPLTEDAPLTPISLYGRTKVAAEKIVLDSRGISLRFATLFGPSARMRLDLLVNHLTLQAARGEGVVLYEPHFRRNFLHVRDAAWTFWWALAHAREMAGRAFNAGDSRANLTKQELCAAIAQECPEFVWVVSHSASDPDQRDYTVSNTRLEATGWRPQHSLPQGIRQLLLAYQMPIERPEFRNFP